MIEKCPECSYENDFPQEHRYHAGFANQGVLYDDSGTHSLIWSSFDPAYIRLCGDVHPWMLDRDGMSAFEAALPRAPGGGRWRFSNPPRCLSCAAPIGDPLSAGEIYYFEYPDSVILDAGPSRRVLAQYLETRSSFT